MTESLTGKGLQELPEDPLDVLAQLLDGARLLDKATGQTKGGMFPTGQREELLRGIVEMLWGADTWQALAMPDAERQTVDEPDDESPVVVQDPAIATMSVVRRQLDAVEGWQRKESKREAAEAARLASWALGRDGKPRD